METSVVRQRLRETLERAKKRAADRRSQNDAAAREYAAFLEHVAIPLVRQLAGALKADGYAFTVFTPSSTVKLMSDRRAEDFIEILLDTTGDAPRIIGHVSRLRGRNIVETEQPIAGGAPGAVSEQDVLDFLLKELEGFVER
ncbi:MAG TPA: hypothetical protein VFA59_23820 [Vicinamibacterales bacterium]|nr:hypothetical protein [Vicinamibacterales bacterium]